MRRAVHALVLVGALAGCGPDAKAPEKPSTASLFFSNVEISPGRTFPSPLVRGSVSGRPTVFIVDTGAQVSVVDRRLAADAGLDVRAGGEARDPSGAAVAMSKTDAPHLVIDGLGAVPERRTAVIALPEVLTRLGIGAILSPQMLAKNERPVVLDLGNRELRFNDGAAASSVSKSVFDLGPITVCRYDDNGFTAASLVAQAEIDGVETRIEIDTGASATFVVADSEVGKKLRARSDGEHHYAASVAGDIDTAKFANVAARIGEVDATGAIMVMPGKKSDACQYEGRLGIDRLHACTLVIREATAHATCVRAF